MNRRQFFTTVIGAAGVAALAKIVPTIEAAPDYANYASMWGGLSTPHASTPITNLTSSDVVVERAQMVFEYYSPAGTFKGTIRR